MRETNQQDIRLHPRLLLREAVALGPQAVLFLLCVVLAIVSLVAEQGLSTSIDQALRQDARPWPPPTLPSIPTPRSGQA